MQIGFDAKAKQGEGIEGENCHTCEYDDELHSSVWVLYHCKFSCCHCLNSRINPFFVSRHLGYVKHGGMMGMMNAFGILKNYPNVMSFSTELFRLGFWILSLIFACFHHSLFYFFFNMRIHIYKFCASLISYFLTEKLLTFIFMCLVCFLLCLFV